MSLKTFLRLFLFDKKQHALNVIGLTISFTVLLVVGTYLYSEYSFDKHIPNADHKYRLLVTYDDEAVPIFSFSAITKAKDQLPAFKSLCVVDLEGGDVWSDDKHFELDNILYSDSSFINYFDLDFLVGASLSLLNEPNTCILSASSAKQLFGSADQAMGATVKLESEVSLQVKGVYADLPKETHIPADLVFSRETWRVSNSERSKQYFTNHTYKGSLVYVETYSNNALTVIEEQMTSAFIDTHPYSKNIKEAIKKGSMRINIMLQSLCDIHLGSGHVQWDQVYRNNPTTLLVLLIVVVMVLLLAIFNYLNLSTSSSKSRSDKIALLKMLGASRAHAFCLLFQQTTLIVIVSLAFSYLLSAVCLPWFNDTLTSSLSVEQFFQWPFVGLFLSVIAVVCCAAGIYSSFYYASVSSLSREKAESKSTLINLRSTLITLQLVVSIFLLVVLFSIKKQLGFITNNNLGFNKEQIVQLEHHESEDSYNYFVNALSSFPEVLGVTAASNMPCEYINNQGPITVHGVDDDDRKEGCLVGIEQNFFATMQANIIQGHDFSDETHGKNKNTIVNQTTVKKLGLTDPIGKEVDIMRDTYTIIGVVEDIQQRTLHEPALPVCYVSDHANYRQIAIRLSPSNHKNVLSAIEQLWAARYPNRSCNMRFFDQKIQDNYQTESNQLALFNALVFIALLILVLGLVGLINSILAKRTKEIGVRKVNGATVSEILLLLNRDFVKWSLIAFIIACPLAYLAVKLWLQEFAYKINVTFDLFLLSGCVTILVALQSVSIRCLRAARRNPIEALRSE